jgi:formylmethanofuran dehydrogenase subunit D
MSNLRLILITGRTTRQGAGISTGKEQRDYQEATGVIELNQADMDRAALKDGDPVTVKAELGAASVNCRRADIPEGLAFMAFGPACNQLVGGETHASGMPDSKHVNVEIVSSREH